MFDQFPFQGEGGSSENDHEFPFLSNIELYKRSLIISFNARLATGL